MNPFVSMMKIGNQSAILKATSLVGRLTSMNKFATGWCKGMFRPTGCDDYINVVGEHLNGLKEGGDYRLTGRFEIHDSYGPQFQVTGSAIELEPSPDSIARHLQRNFKGIGPNTAVKIVSNFQSSGTLEELRDILVNNPFALDLQKILGKKNPVKIQAKGDGEDGPEMYVYRDMSVRLQGMKIRDGVLKKLARYLYEKNETKPNPIEACWQMFSTDPYDPIRTISGYGFSQADMLGQKLGVPSFAPCRLAALAIHALREGCESMGHTFLVLSDFQKCISKIDGGADCGAAINAAIERRWPMVCDKDPSGAESKTRYYPVDLFHAEVQVAVMLAKRSKTQFVPIFHEPGRKDLARAAIESAERRVADGFRLDDSQRDALMSILMSNVGLHSLTAGPGCGKTAIMELLIDIVKGKRNVLFAAPTGKAARVLGKRTAKFGIHAQTIHSLLGPTGEGFSYNAGNKLSCDVLILDESSMIDIELLRSVVEALPEKAHLILLGDVGQLPSVGPGRALSDLLALPGDHHRLTTTHRNDGGILSVVRQAGAGTMDCLDRADVRFTHILPEPDQSSMNKVINTYKRFIDESGIAGVGLLLSRRAGNIETPGWNTTYMNHVIRQAMNPDGQKIVGTRLFVGDRILIRKNMNIPQPPNEKGEEISERVVNGDTGRIAAFFMKENSRSEVSHVNLVLDDGRNIRFPGGESLDALSLGYALTVHVSQGSEFLDVIYICTNGMPSFIHRGCVYTAMSRAKKRLVVVGDDGDLRSIVNRNLPRRNSALVERYRKEEQNVTEVAQGMAQPA